MPFIKFGRSWGVQADGMLRRHGLISTHQADQLESWIHQIDPTPMTLFDLLRPLGACFGLGAAYGSVAVHSWGTDTAMLTGGLLMAIIAWQPLHHVIFPERFVALESTSETVIALLYLLLFFAMATSVLVAARMTAWLVSG